MGTFLFDNIIFGPVKSRRLGVSLGINLLPENSKICTFNCIYCECGWTNNADLKNLHWPTIDEFSKALNDKLSFLKTKNENPDVITFAGNGEPTLHPQFPEIIDETITLRNKYFPASKIAVLTNGTKIGFPKVFKALKLIDDCIIKLDSATSKTIKQINQPFGKINMQEYVRNIKKFQGNCIIQSLFLRGTINNENFDNTTTEEIDNLLKLLKDIKPKKVQIYTFARDTAHQTLQKVCCNTLKNIAGKVEKLGISTHISV